MKLILNSQKLINFAILIAIQLTNIHTMDNAVHNVQLAAMKITPELSARHAMLYVQHAKATLYSAHHVLSLSYSTIPACLNALLITTRAPPKFVFNVLPKFPAVLSL